MKIGMGWLGWGEQQTLDCSIDSLLLAHEGRLEFLRAIFGGGSNKKDGPPTNQFMSASTIGSIFRTLASA